MSQQKHPPRLSGFSRRCVTLHTLPLLSAASALVLSTAAAPALAQYTSMIDATVTPIAGSYYSTPVVVPIESKYIPNVVWRENGAASAQALKVQAVAARAYLYYKYSQTPNGAGATSIADGTTDQVYSKAGTAPKDRPANPNDTFMKYFLAADDTEREILLTSGNEPICGFYVAGGIPSSSGAAPFGQWETGDPDPTNTEQWVTYNRGMTGANVDPTPLGSLSNPVNRGANSQNGSDFLSDNGWNYFDILKYYYGQDAQLVMAKTPGTGQLPANQKVLASFELDQGYLRNAMSLSASNRFIDYAQSSKTRDTSTDHAGIASQKMIIKYDSAADTLNQGFTFRSMSGMVMGTEADPSLNDGLIGAKTSNILIEPRGSFGFFAKTSSANLTAQPLLDEGAATEKGILRNIIADGQWHKYEWFLTDTLEWDDFSSGNGSILSQWSLDSLMFFGKSDASFNIDTVFYDGRTTVPTNQWAYDSNGSYNFAGNWINAAPNGLGAAANFLAMSSAKRTVSVDSNVTVGTINFNNTLGYDIAGAATLTLDVASGSAAINAQSAGINTITAPLMFNDATTIDVVSGGTVVLAGNVNAQVSNPITKTGSGILTISGNVVPDASGRFRCRQYQQLDNQPEHVGGRRDGERQRRDHNLRRFDGWDHQRHRHWHGQSFRHAGREQA